MDNFNVVKVNHDIILLNMVDEDYINRNENLDFLILQLKHFQLDLSIFD